MVKGTWPIPLRSGARVGSPLSGGCTGLSALTLREATKAVVHLPERGVSGDTVGKTIPQAASARFDSGPPLHPRAHRVIWATALRPQPLAGSRHPVMLRSSGGLAQITGQARSGWSLTQEECNATLDGRPIR